MHMIADCNYHRQQGKMSKMDKDVAYKDYDNLEQYLVSFKKVLKTSKFKTPQAVHTVNVFLDDIEATLNRIRKLRSRVSHDQSVHLPFGDEPTLGERMEAEAQRLNRKTRLEASSKKNVIDLDRFMMTDEERLALDTNDVEDNDDD